MTRSVYPDSQTCDLAATLNISVGDPKKGAPKCSCYDRFSGLAAVCHGCRRKLWISRYQAIDLFFK